MIRPRILMEPSKIRCRIFGHKLRCVFRGAGMASDVMWCSRCNSTFYRIKGST